MFSHKYKNKGGERGVLTVQVSQTHNGRGDAGKGKKIGGKTKVERGGEGEGKKPGLRAGQRAGGTRARGRSWGEQRGAAGGSGGEEGKGKKLGRRARGEVGGMRARGRS